MITVDLLTVYNTYFQPNYKVVKSDTAVDIPPFGVIAQKPDIKQTVFGGDISYKNAVGQTIFLPVELWVDGQTNLKIDCCTLRITSKKTIIRTAVSERKGTVKEEFNIGDYIFTITGVLIGWDRQFPSDQIVMLRTIYEADKPVELRNALGELFLEKSIRVAVESLEFPDHAGKALYHKPFTMVCESDFVDTLKVIE